MGGERIGPRAFASKVMSAEDAAGLIPAGATVGMSGFTGAGYPKQVPGALARRIADAAQRGNRAMASAPGRHTLHLLAEALSWHVRYLRTGTMRGEL